MKRPSWVTAVGIIGILFGALGIMGGMQEMVMPNMLQMQREMFKAMGNSPNVDRNKPTQEAPRGLAENNTPVDNAPVGPSHDNVRRNPNPAFAQQMEKMFDVPPWFASWCVGIGIAKIIVSIFYLFASIWLLMMKPSSIKLFYWAAGASILLGLVKAGVGISAFSFMIMAMMMGSMFGVVIDVVMIVVVAISDKAAFQPNQESDEPEIG